jgi:tRNA A-37 threonylcarbamoyl transferase component Bud32
MKRLYHEARGLETPARQAFLAEACGDDDALHDEIADLLADPPGDDGDSFLAPPAESVIGGLTGAGTREDPQRVIGTRIGRYEIVELIATGGMGDVYLARRADDAFEKRVAVKLLRQGLTTSSLRRRFRQERQALASLEHPNITRLLDGGTTDDGRPYLVMEFVPGRPIDEYCDAGQLGLRERVQLFQRVCSAVKYAHQKLLVHRDLKPANILVTTDGLVKLVDFGIAGLLVVDRSQEMPRRHGALRGGTSGLRAHPPAAEHEVRPSKARGAGRGRGGGASTWRAPGAVAPPARG